MKLKVRKMDARGKTIYACLTVLIFVAWFVASTLVMNFSKQVARFVCYGVLCGGLSNRENFFEKQRTEGDVKQLFVCLYAVVRKASNANGP